MLIDSFHRVHDYLRISLTDNCNLRCSYCMPEEEYDFTPASRLMQVDEVLAIAKVFVEAGVRKIRLTGGEPLVRKDAAQIIEKLSGLGVELTMTTNATRVHEFLDLMQAVGMKKVNVSLDTLNRDTFLFLTKRDMFDRVRENIDLLLDRGFSVKVNAVVMRGVNESEILDFVRWSATAPLDVRFIEFMPFDGNHWQQEKVVTWQQMLDVVRNAYGSGIEPLPRNPHETVKQYRVVGGKGTFAVISTLSAPFCGDCNRLRLTADGKMKNCLFSKGEADLLGALRRGESLTTLIQETVREKALALGGQFSADLENIDATAIVNRSMITIGG
jgi:cyclic pyranopterin phosphate synthase